MLHAAPPRSAALRRVLRWGAAALLASVTGALLGCEKPPAAAPPATVEIAAPDGSADEQGDGSEARATAPSRDSLRALREQHCADANLDAPLKLAPTSKVANSEPVTLGPGECVTAVATGLDAAARLELVADNPLFDQRGIVLAVGQRPSASEAVLGGGGSCYANPTPVPWSVRLRLMDASRPAWVQLCRRTRATHAGAE